MSLSCFRAPLAALALAVASYALPPWSPASAEPASPVTVVTHFDIIPNGNNVALATALLEKFVLDSRSDPGVTSFKHITWAPTTNHFPGSWRCLDLLGCVQPPRGGATHHRLPIRRMQEALARRSMNASTRGTSPTTINQGQAAPRDRQRVASAGRNRASRHWVAAKITPALSGTLWRGLRVIMQPCPAEREGTSMLITALSVMRVQVFAKPRTRLVIMSGCITQFRGGNMTTEVRIVTSLEQCNGFAGLCRPGRRLRVVRGRIQRVSRR